MTPHRVSIKLYVTDPAAVDLDAVIPLFHDWIQQATVPGMLIDVADYRHMVDGPGVVLIGHDVDYALDLARGRAGLLHTRKRTEAASLADHLTRALHDALVACRAFESDDRFGGRLRFRTDEASLIFPDRLRAPNEASGFEGIRGEIAACVEPIYDGASVDLQREVEDDRRCLTVRLSAPGAVDVKTLIERAARQSASRS